MLVNHKKEVDKRNVPTYNCYIPTKQSEVRKAMGEEYKKYIIEMIQHIDDNQHLKRIFNYVHKYFIRRTGK